MFKNLLGIVIAITLLGGIVILAGENQRKNNLANVGAASEGALTIDESSYDFGSISMADGKVQHEFKIKNNSSKPITINKIYTSCMCTTATLEIKGKKFGPYGMPGHGFIPSLNKSVESGEEVVVKAVFDPTAHGPAGIGRIERVVTIETNNGQPLEPTFSATVTP